MPDAPPAVSIVIPAYNRAATIRAAIESVLRQTWTDFELIVVDDGSTDDTLAEAAKVADPRLRLVESPANGGAAAARNRGLAEARADWVAFQDSDDEWLPRKLEKQMARLTAPGADFVAAYCGMLILDSVYEEGRAAGRLTPRYFPGPEETEVEGDLLLAAAAHEPDLDPDADGPARRAARDRRVRRVAARARGLGMRDPAGAAGADRLRRRAARRAALLAQQHHARPRGQARRAPADRGETRGPARRASGDPRAASLHDRGARAQGRRSRRRPCVARARARAPAGERPRLGDLALRRRAVARAAPGRAGALSAARSPMR